MAAHVVRCPSNPSGIAQNGRDDELTVEQLKIRERNRKKIANRRRMGKDKPAKVAEPKVKRNHSEETKSKIRAARIAYLEANPDKVPYLVNHYSNGPSYPETYFNDLLTTEGFTFKQEYRIGLYSLDFAFPDLLIDLEINGSQHYDDPRIVESDIRRRAFLEDLGWTVITVDWRSYQKLDFVQRTQYVTELLGRLRPILT